MTGPGGGGLQVEGKKPKGRGGGRLFYSRDAKTDVYLTIPVMAPMST